MASRRVSPPSAGSTRTMLALLSLVCDRAWAMLSIFTASTGPSFVTGLPVNGDAAWSWQSAWQPVPCPRSAAALR